MKGNHVECYYCGTKKLGRASKGFIKLQLDTTGEVVEICGRCADLDPKHRKRIPRKSKFIEKATNCENKPSEDSTIGDSPTVEEEKNICPKISDSGASDTDTVAPEDGKEDHISKLRGAKPSEIIVDDPILERVGSSCIPKVKKTTRSKVIIGGMPVVEDPNIKKGFRFISTNPADEVKVKAVPDTPIYINGGISSSMHSIEPENHYKIFEGKIYKEVDIDDLSREEIKEIFSKVKCFRK